MSILGITNPFLVLATTCSLYTHVLATRFQARDNVSSHINGVSCPDAEDIDPCICTYYEIDDSLHLDCTNIADEEQLYSVFHAYIPFPDFLTLFVGTDHLETLTDSVFGDVTFQEVFAIPSDIGTLTSVGPKTFMKSASTLKLLYLYDNKLSDFPFNTLCEYTQLSQFNLHNNPIPTFPIIQSESLSSIDFGGSTFDTIPAGALDGLPNLHEFRVQHTNITSMATGIFASLSKMYLISMKNTGLTHLYNHQFEFNSDDINIIDLMANQISKVYNKAFKGVQSAHIDLRANQLTILPEETWRTVLDAGNEVWLQGNNLTCGCDIAWLVLEPTYHELVDDAYCHTGDRLVDLDPSDFENC
ncbi:unnamed protein product [Meganyctiphanes norvegica]|uniref:Oplophorus-luciferin 2-monooxygenase non-catalytic subunit n=1 Tax=Meganyctiphanes norvegica TaxID=48144 RepID=A0AAV2R5Y0_MEGNR